MEVDINEANGDPTNLIFFFNFEEDYLVRSGSAYTTNDGFPVAYGFIILSRNPAS